MTPCTRRRFMTTTGTAAAAAAVSTRADEISDGWIDAHVHVWTKDRDVYPISENFSGKKMDPPRFPPATLFAEQEGTGVTRTVLIQMSFYEFDNSYMTDQIASYPERFRGVGIVDHEDDGVAEKMIELKGQGVRGFRLYAFPDRVAKWENSGGIQKMWKTGAEEGLAMCCLTDPAALPVVHKMCEKHPGTTTVIDHFARIGARGEVDQGELDRLLALADFENVYVKTSAFYALGKKAPPYTDLAPMFKQVRDAFGSERLMWGSDCPYQVRGDHTYEASVALVREGLDFLSAEEKEEIMKNTAEKVFFG